MNDWKTTVKKDKTIKKEYSFQTWLELNQAEFEEGQTTEKSVKEYMESREADFRELNDMQDKYQNSGRVILEKIWNENPFDDNSKEFRLLEKLMERDYKELGIDPRY